MNIAEAEKMIEDVAEFLKTASPQNCDKLEDDESVEWLARVFAGQLLEAADADGMNGCRLCQN